jgi:transcriptional regulator with GAF, ATPase, and Fis domain
MDVRFIFATNRDLVDCVRGGRFRRDLYHRCAALYIYLLPLRERRDEIPPLVARILRSIVQAQAAKGTERRFLSRK